MSVGGQHVCAIDLDEHVQCWGIEDGSADDFGQVTDAPIGNLPVNERLSGTFTAADSVSCTVTPSDGIIGQPASSGTEVIQSSAPLALVTITPNPATGNDTLTCHYSASDPDGDPVTVEYEWSLNGNIMGSGSTLSGVFNPGDGSRARLRHPTLVRSVRQVTIRL